MIGLLLKDFYILRQYVKTMLLMLVIFAFISAGLDNPATFFVGVIVFMSMMMTITSFSYDTLAKWDRYALSMPVTRKEVVAAKYLLSIILCLAGAAVSSLISFVVLQFRPIEGYGMTEHLYAISAIVCIALFFSAILLPMVFQFGVEKCRLLLIAIFAAPTAAVIALSKMGVSMPSEASLISALKLLPLFTALLYLLSYLISLKIFGRKEI